MHRILIPPDAVKRSSLTIQSPKTLHHLRHVLRIRAGSSLECFDGTGHYYLGRVIQANTRAVVVQIEKTVFEKPLPVMIHLVPALIRPERFSWMIQKTTELGVASIHPIMTHRTIVRHDKNDASHKLQRWQRIAQEAAQQCKRVTVPEILTPKSFTQFLKFRNDSLLILPTVSRSTQPLQHVLDHKHPYKSITILIGPEGDFTEKEIEMAQDKGAVPVSLGPLTLRSETAALTSVAMVHYAAGLTLSNSIR